MTGIKQKGGETKGRKTRQTDCPSSVLFLSSIFFCLFLPPSFVTLPNDRDCKTKQLRQSAALTDQETGACGSCTQRYVFIHSPSHPVTPSCTDGCPSCFLSVTWHTEGCQWPHTHTHVQKCKITNANAKMHNIQYIKHTYSTHAPHFPFPVSH